MIIKTMGIRANSRIVHIAIVAKPSLRCGMKRPVGHENFEYKGWMALQIGSRPMARGGDASTVLPIGSVLLANSLKRAGVTEPVAAMRR